MTGFKIIYQDEQILVVNKPAGLVVNRAESVGEATLQDLIEKQLPEIFGQNIAESKLSDFFKRSGIVHRLDRETSGILLVAKDERAFLNLQGQFKARLVEKEYLALCHGRLEKQGVIAADIGRLPKKLGKFAVVQEGKQAETAYEVLDYFRLADRDVEVFAGNLRAKDVNYYRQFAFFSYLKLYPKTGRTHQIRVHLKSLQRPIVSDRLYLNKRLYQFDLNWCPRLFLHAAAIKFAHPVTGRELAFSLDLPNDLKKALNRLEEAE